MNNELEIFDCNACFGDSGRPAFRYARTASELIKEMDFCGIDQALVYHAGQRFGSPELWNERLSAAVESLDRLNATWVILPWQTGEQAKPQEFLDAMRAKGIRALRAFPQEHHYRLDGCTFGLLLRLLVEKRIPLLVKDHLVAVGELLAEFPDLTVVAVNQGPHSLERYLRPLVETYPNLYLDTSYYLLDGAIEEFCERYGPGRLLFGSGFPDNCSGASLLRIVQAGIDQQAKRAIAGGNLKLLLEQVQI